MLGLDLTDLGKCSLLFIKHMTNFVIFESCDRLKYIWLAYKYETCINCILCAKNWRSEKLTMVLNFFLITSPLDIFLIIQNTYKLKVWSNYSSQLNIYILTVYLSITFKNYHNAIFTLLKKKMFLNIYYWLLFNLNC